MVGPEIIQDTAEKVTLIKGRLEAAAKLYGFETQKYRILVW